eukprot:snap_masked-scaffold868_size86715-processed-gene-0.6 protein:Tk02338 transcript:snap_masked-scaffold868_size86715-processed-gene-0.6-mRNA-1 annotation:"probable sulfite mitochondrial"
MYLTKRKQFALVHAKSTSILESAGSTKSGLPTFRMADISKHDALDKRVWVTYKHGVYDITDFVPKHPGAKNIMMAAGGSIEPFWETYAVHKNNQEVYRMLEDFRIGNLDEQDFLDQAKAPDAHDPFANEPKRHPALKPSSQKPFNAETPLEFLMENFYTPNEMFFVRSHLPTPEIEGDQYELEVSGLGVHDKVFTLKDLKAFPKHTITSVIQCGGNRRSEMNAVKPLKGLNWEGGAIGNATWSGAKLSDVLHASGVIGSGEKRAKHIQFEGYDVGADGSPYGASIHYEKGINPYEDVLLAYEMNGEPVPRDHGFPIRVVVPGVVGARNVKWLNRIIIADHESESHWQQNDYKGFNPSVSWDNVDFSKAAAIQSMPVTSAICSPSGDALVKSGKLSLKGYAWSGGGSKIIRVDITADGGRTWQDARLLKQEAVSEPHHYGWTLWQVEVDVPKGTDQVEVWSKAVDSNYNVQPESFENIWNLRGLLSNAYSKRVFSVQH